MNSLPLRRSRGRGLGRGAEDRKTFRCSTRPGKVSDVPPLSLTLSPEYGGEGTNAAAVMANTEIESSPLFGLMTDALRAGPGSPEWHQAVAKLRAEGLADSDEYRLLVNVREHLESGRDYRSIRAGAGFTKKVMDAIAAEKPPAPPRRKLPLATIIAVVSLAVVVGVAAYVIYQLTTKNNVAQSTVEELEQSYFPTEIASAKLDSTTLPAGWKTIGSLPLEATKNGLKPTLAATTTNATQPTTQGGALVFPQPIAADQPFAVMVQLKPGRASDGLIVQVFVSAEGDFSADKATSSNELVWLLQGTRQKVVLADSRVEFDQPRSDPAATGGKAEGMTVRVVVDRQFAVVTNNGQRLWAGPNGLAAKPRTVGVRFLSMNDGKAIDPSVIQSVKVLRK